MTYGELTGTKAPAVLLADGQRPAVLVVGMVWAAEWWSGQQEFTISQPPG
ncbi:hypothetical protein [Actinoplanes sp. NPDC048796]